MSTQKYDPVNVILTVPPLKPPFCNDGLELGESDLTAFVKEVGEGFTIWVRSCWWDPWTEYKTC